MRDAAPPRRHPSPELERASRKILGEVGRRAALCAPAALLLLAAARAAEPSWPCWRGPGGQGISNERGFPTDWSPTRNIAWKTPLEGRGHSSPIVWGNRIFLTTDVEGDVVPGAGAVKHVLEGQEFVHPETVGADRRHSLRVLCVELENGRVLWNRPAYEGLVHDSRHRKASFASPTPVTDGKRVFSYFGSEGVTCHDFEGKLIWKASVGKIATLGMGVGSSPVLQGDRLILQCDEDNGEHSFITALDAATGQESWKTPRKTQVSWATPSIIDQGGAVQVVASGNEKIVAYEPASGKELWEIEGLASNAIHTPLVGGGLVYFSAGYPRKITMAVEPGREAKPRVAWKYERGTGYVVSPILYEGHVYLLGDQGIVTCLDARTGEVKYGSFRLPRPARFTASPVAFDGKLLLVSEEGDAFVLRAGAEPEVLATSSIEEPVHATPALSQGRILLRTERCLYSILCVS